jgi:hypothetical protein
MAQQQPAVALFDFQATDPRHLQLRAGQRLTVLDSRRDDWWQVSDGARKGYAPATYIQPQVSSASAQPLLMSTQRAQGNAGGDSDDELAVDSSDDELRVQISSSSSARRHRIDVTATPAQARVVAAPPVAAPARFVHVAPDGQHVAFSPADCVLIASARRRGLPAVRIADVHLPGGTTLQFEVRLGANATSAKMPVVPASGMCQVNLATDNTRVVEEAAPDPTAVGTADDAVSPSQLAPTTTAARKEQFFHVAPDGQYVAFSPADCVLIAGARRRGLPAVRIADVHLPGGTTLQFEVRLGANATSAKMPVVPASGMCQVNLATDNTRVVEEAAKTSGAPLRRGLRSPSPRAASPVRIFRSPRRPPPPVLAAPPAATDGCFVVTFSQVGSLGLILGTAADLHDTAGSGAGGRGSVGAGQEVVLLGVKPGTQAEAHPTLVPGLVLRAVNSFKTQDKSLHEVLDHIRSSPSRPLHMVFAPAPPRPSKLLSATAAEYVVSWKSRQSPATGAHYLLQSDQDLDVATADFDDELEARMRGLDCCATGMAGQLFTPAAWRIFRASSTTDCFFWVSGIPSLSNEGGPCQVHWTTMKHAKRAAKAAMAHRGGGYDYDYEYLMQHAKETAFIESVTVDPSQMPPRVPADLRQRALLITTHSGELALSFTGDDDGSVRDRWLAGCRTLLSYFSASLPRLLSKTRSPQTLLQGMVPYLPPQSYLSHLLLNYGLTEICLRSAIPTVTLMTRSR